ncbi:zygote arrest protein 2.S-like [Ahaetulla prasina]|uniref:zygote arrest protein 2.S-like n=1 Tax=Ahaetulla prasina TaxID=499056 RepID=UPI0026496AF7|nr:zygote arrest protein 2.S-like [Ahaetulla prasina]
MLSMGSRWVGHDFAINNNNYKAKGAAVSRQANTKEVGVPVNLRADAVVQCLLGSQQLQAAWAAFLSTQPGVRGKGNLRREGGGWCRREGGSGGRGSGYSAQQQVGQGGEAEEGWSRLDEEGRRTTFQFLEQKYGNFHCNDYKTRWESAYVWCISGTNKVYFKQLCRKCQKSFNPYKVEAIQCQICSKTRCSCPQKKRHIDLKRPHRQELCGRCKGKRLSCDNTYSFKYIV